jgi:hypothetical protein
MILSQGAGVERWPNTLLVTCCIANVGSEDCFPELVSVAEPIKPTARHLARIRDRPHILHPHLGESYEKPFSIENL